MYFMKKSKIFLCFSIICLMFLSITNVYAADNVKIKSVELIDKSVNTTETSDATFEGLTMNFNLNFSDVGDYAKYKVTVENNENKDYKVLIDSNFGNSKYITYDYVKTDNLKANSDSEFYVTVLYKNEVDESSFSDGKYIEKNSAVLKLDDGSISNPLTSNNEIILVVGLLIITVGLFVLFKNKINKNINFMVLFITLSIPLFVKAIDSLKITVNSNIEIEKKYFVAYEDYRYIKASELKDYDLTYAERDDTIYIGSVSEENKYIYYSDAILKGKKKYAPGENVNIIDTDLPNYYYYVDWDNCKCSDGSSLVNYSCSGRNNIVCNEVFTEYADFLFDDYMYSFDSSERFGFKVNDDDNTVMKFMNADDNWDSEKRIIINSKTSFTMPNHDVLFTVAYNDTEPDSLRSSKRLRFIKSLR